MSDAAAAAASDAHAHDFAPAFFTKPTTCAACGKMVWGITKKQQKGLECKDSSCGAKIHAKCQPEGDGAALPVAAAAAALGGGEKAPSTSGGEASVGQVGGGGSSGGRGPRGASGAAKSISAAAKPFDMARFLGPSGSEDEPVPPGKLLTKIGCGALETVLADHPDEETGLVAMYAGKDSGLVVVMSPPGGVDGLAVSGSDCEGYVSGVIANYRGASYSDGFGAEYNKSGRYSKYDLSRVAAEIPGAIFAIGLENGSKVDGLTMWRDVATSHLRIAFAQSDVHTVEVWDCGAISLSDLGGENVAQSLSWAPREKEWRSGAAHAAKMSFLESPHYEAPKRIHMFGTPHRGCLGYGVSDADKRSLLGSPYDVKYGACDAALPEPVLFVLHYNGDYKNFSVRAFSAESFDVMFNLDFGESLGHSMALAVRSSSLSAFSDGADLSGKPDRGKLKVYEKTSPLPLKSGGEPAAIAIPGMCPECDIVDGHMARCSLRNAAANPDTTNSDSNDSAKSNTLSGELPFGLAVRGPGGWNVIVLHFGAGELVYAVEQTISLAIQEGQVYYGCFDRSGRFWGAGSGPPNTSSVVSYMTRAKDHVLVGLEAREIGFRSPINAPERGGSVEYQRFGVKCAGIMLDEGRQRVICIHNSCLTVYATPNLEPIPPPSPPLRKCMDCGEDREKTDFVSDYSSSCRACELKRPRMMEHCVG